MEMSLVLPHQVGMLLKVQRLPLRASVGECWAEIVPFTLEMVKVRAVGVRSVGVRGAPAMQTSQGGILPTRRVRTVAGGNNCGLEHRSSEMNQTQLDSL